jgi:hypothetical protein
VFTQDDPPLRLAAELPVAGAAPKTLAPPQYSVASRI